VRPAVATPSSGKRTSAPSRAKPVSRRAR
jgi:hypothetical protein